ncbi:MAG: DUF416 family protein [Bryobacteraceae bacterium]|nr:DUF416 family protein [Bryobacteraceae bacterium]
MSFEGISLDAALDRLQAEVGGLSRRQAAAFYAVCGRALFPLYEEFVQQTGWGDPNVLRAAESLALKFAAGAAPQREKASQLLEEVAAAIPDGERFDAPGSTFAQDVAICMDAALRATIAAEEVNPGWIEYALEPATIAAAEEQTGFTDPGTSEAGEEWRAHALRHPGLRDAYQTASDLIALTAKRSTFRAEDLANLRDVASGLLTGREA